MEEKKKNFKLCDLCDCQATFLCLECPTNYFCDSCYKFIHEKKTKSSHQKEKIDYYVPIETRCSAHKDVPLNLFCTNEKGISYLF